MNLKTDVFVKITLHVAYDLQTMSEMLFLLMAGSVSAASVQLQRGGGITAPSDASHSVIRCI